MSQKFNEASSKPEFDEVKASIAEHRGALNDLSAMSRAVAKRLDENINKLKNPEAAGVRKKKGGGKGSARKPEYVDKFGVLETMLGKKQVLETLPVWTAPFLSRVNLGDPEFEAEGEMTKAMLSFQKKFSEPVQKEQKVSERAGRELKGSVCAAAEKIVHCFMDKLSDVIPAGRFDKGLELLFAPSAYGIRKDSEETNYEQCYLPCFRVALIGGRRRVLAVEIATLCSFFKKSGASSQLSPAGLKAQLQTMTMDDVKAMYEAVAKDSSKVCFLEQQAGDVVFIPAGWIVYDNVDVSNV